MTERSVELTIERPESSARKLGATSLESARQLTAAARGIPVEEVTVGHIAEEFATGGFNEWPADIAHEVRDVLATEHDMGHL